MLNNSLLMPGQQLHLLPPQPTARGQVPSGGFDLPSSVYARMREVETGNSIAVPSQHTINAVVGELLAARRSEAFASPIAGVAIAAPAATEFELTYAGAVKAGIPVTLVPTATEFGADISASVDLSYVVEATGLTHALTGVKPGELDVTALNASTGRIVWTPTYKGLAFSPISWNFTTVRDAAPAPGAGKQEQSLSLTPVTGVSLQRISDIITINAGSSYKFFTNVEFGVVNPDATNGASGLALQWRTRNAGAWSTLGAAFTSDFNCSYSRVLEADEFVTDYRAVNEVVYQSRGAVNNEQTLAIGTTQTEVALFAARSTSLNQTLGFFSKALLQEQ